MKNIRFLFLLLLLVQSYMLFATHIVGGEMTYTCLGNDEYEIKLTIFRDCYNGDPNAWFDDPASIGVFDGATNELVQEILIPLPDINDTLDPILTSECLVVPPDVCVHTTTYTTTTILPFNPNGYQLAYQRCCRNVTITNIVEPLATGATYGVFITPFALTECNSSAVFSPWPPIYICANVPIEFDHSAFDPDGDSIVYTLCTPIQGADQIIPQPQPPNNPPYQEIVWVDPPYNVNNMLNGTAGDPPLTIDEDNGLLTGLPNTVGQFVVGICVEEYRNGQLISTTRRDFQYNVGVCGITTAAFFAPDFQCGDPTVFFDNQSQEANDFLWYFDWQNNPQWTSDLFSPTFTYPDNGTYEVILVAEPNTVCADTFFHTTTILPASLVPAFEASLIECGDSAIVQLTDLSTDSNSSISEWLWEITFGTDTETFDIQNPQIEIGEDETLNITLTVTAENGCVEEITDIYIVDVIEEELVADTTVVCIGDSVFLHPNFTPNYLYDWSPGTALTATNIGNPAAFPTETTTYQVTITNPENGCETEREIMVFIPEPLQVFAGNDTTICSTDFELQASTNTGIEFYWATDPDFNNIFATTANTTVTPFGETAYYLLVRDEYGCPNTDEIIVTGNGINNEQDSLQLLCLGDTIMLAVNNIDPIDNLTYSWTPTEDIISGANTASPTVAPDEAGTFVYYVEMTNQFGCTKIDSTTLGVLDTLDQTDFVFAVQCSGYSVQFTNTSVNAPYYIWDFGDPSNPNDQSTIDNPSYTYPTAGNYTVSLYFPATVETCADTISKAIAIGEPLIDIAFDYEFAECSDSVVIEFIDQSTNVQSTIIDWNWTFSNNDQANAQNASTTLYENQILTAQLIVTSDDGCMDTLDQDIPIELIDAMLTDTIIVCRGASAPLNPDGDFNYDYNWSPAATLDDATSPNPMASPLETTIYSVTISDYSGVDTCQIVREVVAFVPPELTITTSNDTIICDPEVTLFAEGNGLYLEWSTEPDFSSIFSDDGQIVVEPERPSYYYVRTVDEYACTAEEAIEVGNYSPAIEVDIDQVICENDTTLITATSIFPEDEMTWNWYPNTGIISGQGTNQIAVSPSSSTTYTVFAENQYGCSIEEQSMVTVLNLIPNLTATAFPDTIYEGQSSQLTATFDINYDYLWAPENSLNNTIIHDPIASPSSTTLYEVEVTDEFGCINRTTVEVVVIPPLCDESFVFIPTAFSPNNDSQNDLWGVYSSVVEEMYLIVYNRWGEKVFETTDAATKWNGLNSEELPHPADVYGWHIRYRCFGNDTFYEQQGNVTLLR